MPGVWEKYQSNDLYDELISANGNPRSAAKRAVNFFSGFTDEELKARNRSAELAIKEMGISFTVYSDGKNIDRPWPYDIIPRIIPSSDWTKVSKGLLQRVKAINYFIDDIYNKQRVLADNIIPAEVVLDSPNYKPQCAGFSPRFGVWANICGSDIIRDHRGKFSVLEDNLRVPSGVSYMIENREVTKRIIPDLFENHSILPVDDYPTKLYEMLIALSPRKIRRPSIAVLTPGIYNSAYFEHAFLAQGMGAQLVEGGDLFVAENERVYMRTVDGPEQVDVIYRRIDDEFMDPEVFRSDSILGVPGLTRSWRSGRVSIANAPGSGVADDKVIYAFVPKLIRYYLNEKPLIDNVRTYLCMREIDREFVLKNIAELVIKPANESGGYGIMVGPHSSVTQHKKFARLIEDNPRDYIAQPTINLSTTPTLIDGEIEPRHVDLRPFVLQSSVGWVTPGGLTRVALKKGSLVVNSSQGGGSKDTWIIEGGRS